MTSTEFMLVKITVAELALKHLYPFFFAFSLALKLKVKNETKWNDVLRQV